MTERQLSLQKMDETQQSLDPMVDLWFPVLGRELPADHGYLAYGALTTRVPVLHSFRSWGLHTVRGNLLGNGQIRLPRYSRIGIRLPASMIVSVLGLAGSRLTIGTSKVRLGAPTVEGLLPSPSLSARIVTIKGFTEADEMVGAVQRQMQLLSIAGSIVIGQRKVLKIRERKVVGFTVSLAVTNDSDSMKILTHGIGGRRRFGCGLFRASNQAFSNSESAN